MTSYTTSILFSVGPFFSFMPCVHTFALTALRIEVYAMTAAVGDVLLIVNNLPYGLNSSYRHSLDGNIASCPCTWTRNLRAGKYCVAIKSSLNGVPNTMSRISR